MDSTSADELYKSMLPAFSKDGGMDEKGIRDALKRETERMARKEETPLSQTSISIRAEFVHTRFGVQKTVNSNQNMRSAFSTTA